TAEPARKAERAPASNSRSAHGDVGREGDHGGSEAGRSAGTDDPRDRAAGRSRARAPRQDYSRGGRVHGCGETRDGRCGDPEGTGRDSIAISANGGGDGRRKEYDHRVSTASRYNCRFGTAGPGSSRSRHTQVWKFVT